MSGKHRKQSRSNTGRLVAIAATTGAFAALGTATATAAPDWDTLATCESQGSGGWEANTGNGFYGGIQFAQSTWEEFGGLEFADRADLASKEQQILVGERVLAAQGNQAWPDCSNRVVPGWDTAGAEVPPPAPEIAPAAPEPAPAAPVALSPYEWPVDAPMSQGFGNGHDGIDLAAPIGTALHAPASGVVDEGGMGTDPGGYGNYIGMTDEAGNKWQMGHLSEIYVSTGDYVSVGQVVGATGNAGSSTGPHLHLRLHTGEGPVDPAAFLNSVGAANTGEHLDPPVSEVPPPAPVPEPAPGEGESVVVTDGDTLSGIADAHGTSWQEIWGLNPQIQNPDLIYPGDEVRVS